MANRFGMEAAPFEATLRATIFPQAGSREEFAAFLLVAREYNLNPITREIYAMPKKGGGIIPVVSIDGWVRLANEHKAFDGMEFVAEHGEDGKLISMTCRIFRKDRAHPTEVTEYLSECKRDTDPWKMQHRMLRHKSMIQCARYAFGFAGIYDEDEAERFAATAARDVTPRRAPAAEPPIPPALEHKSVEIPQTPPVPPPLAAEPPAIDYAAALEAYRTAAMDAQDIEQLDAAWANIITPIENDLPKDLYEEAAKIDDLRRGMLDM
jgi:phage recombination protein Bet